eukprot:scaffold497318_cov46-Prasinocladus_malaysianus.AAC.1
MVGNHYPLVSRLYSVRSRALAQPEYLGGLSSSHFWQKPPLIKPPQPRWGGLEGLVGRYGVPASQGRGSHAKTCNEW